MVHRLQSHRLADRPGRRSAVTMEANMTRKAILQLSVLALVLPGFAYASSGQASQAGRSYTYGHISYVEGEVTLQRAIEPEPSGAGVNEPVTPGDRAWTATFGRAEVRLADGSLLRMDERTKVDFVAFGEAAGQETLVRLWSGSIILRLVDAGGATFRVDTPGGSIFPVSEGLIRIDVDESGTTTLSVYEGVSELASEGGSVLARSGQRSLVQSGLRPEPSYEFNTARWDEFSSWSDGRDQLYRRTTRVRGVQEEVAVYSGELDHYGTWRRDTSYGNVWYPRVSVGWSPYYQGRWAYTAFGWTWVSYEPWGWAPYHYGRWGHGAYGWYWIPGAHWGPAWVSWAFGPSWVGWSPLGYHDRPVFGYRSVFHYRGGRAVPRHRVTRGWSFSRNQHFASRSAATTRLGVEDVRATSNQARLLESGAILDRRLAARAVGPAAMTRAARQRRDVDRTGSIPGRTTRGLATTRGRVFRSAGTGSGSSAVPTPPARVQQRDRNAAAASRARTAPSSRSDALQRGLTATTRRNPATTPSASNERTTLRRTGARPQPGAGPSSETAATGSRPRVGSTTTRSTTTRTMKRSTGSSVGSKDFFSRRPSVSGSRTGRSSATKPLSTGRPSTAKPRTGSQSKSSSKSSGASRSRGTQKSRVKKNKN